MPMVRILSPHSATIHGMNKNVFLGGESSDESGSDLEDEFMPKKTPVITGPNLSNRTVTSNAKTARHNSVMWSHMCGKNIDQAKPVEIIKYEVSYFFQFKIYL